jgi:hypothetical protein
MEDKLANPPLTMLQPLTEQNCVEVRRERRREINQAAIIWIRSLYIVQRRVIGLS